MEIIANDQGNRTTPSYVGFTDTERLIGDAAKNQVAMNPRNTVFDAKRLIGRKFEDSAVQQDMKHWPFTVVKGPDSKPIIEGRILCHLICALLECFLLQVLESQSSLSHFEFHAHYKSAYFVVLHCS